MFQNLQFIDNKDIKRCIHLKVIIYSHKTLLEYSINVSKLSEPMALYSKKRWHITHLHRLPAIKLISVQKQFAKKH